MPASRIIRALARLAAFAIVIAAGLNAAAVRAEDATAPPRGNAQVEQLVAPIALYPDPLLSQVLMASTYPLEVVEAARWSRDNAQTSGQALETAMQQQSWDPSVKALTAVPQTLQMMNDKLDWTQQLGDAFLAQQKDVLDAVQRLRARADANGQLKSTEHQKITKVAAPPASAAPAGAPAQPAASVYTIEPANPEQYYVPVYDPGTVYGAWPYADYAPFYWTPPGYAAAGALAFGAGVFTGAAIWGHVDWWRNRVDVNVNNFNRFNRTNIANNTWVHNPAHRGGVPYRDRNVAQRFGDPGRAAAREGYRGAADAGRRNLAGQGGANRPRAKANAGAKARAAGRTAPARAKQAARTRQPSQARQATRARQPARAREAARPRPSAQRPQARANAGMRRANVGLPHGGLNRVGAGGLRGGMRGGGRGGFRRR